MERLQDPLKDLRVESGSDDQREMGSASMRWDGTSLTCNSMS